MIDNWLDAIFWVGILCIFLYTRFFEIRVGEEIADPTRIKDGKDQMERDISTDERS
jgi:hypothetical protein